MLLASATTLPLLLAAAGCRSSDAFAGPDPLAGRPHPAPDVVTLQAVIAAEETLIGLYRTAISGDSGTARLRPLLAQHQQHLIQLRARLIVPAGVPTGPASPSSPARTTSPSARATSPARGRVTRARLRTAERASATNLMRRLAVVEPALAAAPGLDQLTAVCEAFFCHVERRTFPGGCFMAGAALELGNRPGPLRELIDEFQARFGALLRGFAATAVHRNELPADEDPGRLAFELNGIMLAADTNFVLHDDPAVLELARQIVHQRLGAAGG